MLLRPARLARPLQRLAHRRRDPLPRAPPDRPAGASARRPREELRLEGALVHRHGLEDVPAHPGQLVAGRAQLRHEVHHAHHRQEHGFHLVQRPAAHHPALRLRRHLGLRALLFRGPVFVAYAFYSPASGVCYYRLFYSLYQGGRDQVKHRAVLLFSMLGLLWVGSPLFTPSFMGSSYSYPEPED